MICDNCIHKNVCGKARTSGLTGCDDYYKDFATLRITITAMSAVDSKSGIGQDTYVIEECSELIKELTKKRRGKGNDSAVVDEACDVLTTILVLLHDLGVSNELIVVNIIFKCTRAVNRFNGSGEI